MCAAALVWYTVRAPEVRGQREREVHAYGYPPGAAASDICKNPWALVWLHQISHQQGSIGARLLAYRFLILTNGSYRWISSHVDCRVVSCLFVEATKISILLLEYRYRRTCTTLWQPSSATKLTRPTVFVSISLGHDFVQAGGPVVIFSFLYPLWNWRRQSQAWISRPNSSVISSFVSILALPYSIWKLPIAFIYEQIAFLVLVLCPSRFICCFGLLLHTWKILWI